MSKVHGKKTVVLVGGIDLTQYSNNSQLEISADTHDTTTYGKDWHLFSGGLLTGTVTVSGFYDSTAVTGPKAALQPLVGVDGTTFAHRPEGTGAGLPQDAGTCVVEKYTQTHPVADMVTWAVDLKISDAVNTAVQ